MSRTRPLPIALLLAALAPLPASAFSVKSTSAGAEVHWAQRKVRFVVVALGDQARDALLYRASKLAAQAWASTGELEIVVEHPRADARVRFEAGKPGENVIAWSNGDWLGDDDDLGLTFLHYDVKTGAILDADIVLNDTHHHWVDEAVERLPDSFDTANVLAHELGHGLGLDHSAIREATMFATSREAEVSKRDLHDDDVEALSVLYSAVGLTATATEAADGAPRGGCRDTGGDASLLGLLGVMVAGMLARVRRARGYFLKY